MSHWPAFDKSVASSDSILAWFLSFFQKWYTLLIDQKLLYSSCVDLIRIFGSCPKRNQTWWAKRHKSQIWSSLPHQRLSSMPGKILLNDRWRTHQDRKIEISEHSRIETMRCVQPKTLIGKRCDHTYIAIPERNQPRTDGAIGSEKKTTDTWSSERWDVHNKWK